MLDKWQEVNLTRFRVELVDSINATTSGLFNHLSRRGVISHRQVAAIQVPINDSFRQVELLLDHMHRRPPEDYQIFTEGLEATGHGAVVARYLSQNATGDARQQETAGPTPVVDTPVGTQVLQEQADDQYLNVRPPDSAQGGAEVPTYMQLDNLSGRVRGLQIEQETNDDLYEELPAVQESEEEDTTIKELLTCIADGIKKQIKVASTPYNIRLKICRESDVYPMKEKVKGKCCIISVKQIITRSERVGTDEDMNSLESLFKEIGYIVNAYSDSRGHDVSSSGIRGIVRRFSWSIEETDQSAVLCLLSHGEKGCIVGTDNKIVMIKDLLSNLDNKNCPNLQNKPRMIFTQSCRGDETDPGMFMSDYASTDATSESLPRTKRLSRQPTLSDFLIGYATQADHRAWRRQNGSIYIRALVLVFMKFAHEFSVPDMLVKVNDLVSRTPIQHAPQEFVTQMPSFENQLRKRLFFLP